MGSRYTDTEQKVMKALKETPGLTITQLAARLGKCRQTIYQYTYNLRREKQAVGSENRETNVWVYFAEKLDGPQPSFVDRVEQYVRENPGQTRQQIGDALLAKASTVGNALQGPQFRWERAKGRGGPRRHYVVEPPKKRVRKPDPDIAPPPAKPKKTSFKTFYEYIHEKPVIVTNIGGQKRTNHLNGNA